MTCVRKTIPQLKGAYGDLAVITRLGLRYRSIVPVYGIPAIPALPSERPEGVADSVDLVSKRLRIVGKGSAGVLPRQCCSRLNRVGERER